MRGAIHPPTCPMELSVFFFPRSSNINSYSLKGASANDKRVLKTLNLAPLVKKPLSCRKHLLIMKKCLANNNPDAHYIKGIIWYFNLDHCDVGLHHIGIAANGGQKEAIYMYVMLLLCRGRTEEGKTYMSQLEWAKDTTMAETCWKQIKTSLNGIRVARKRCYMISLRNMKPPDVCHPRDLDNTCEKCFFYKQMFKFIFMV
ncbi:putative F-box protein [Arabidopsis thaliana]